MGFISLLAVLGICAFVAIVSVVTENMIFYGFVILMFIAFFTLIYGEIIVPWEKERKKGKSNV